MREQLCARVPVRCELSGAAPLGRRAWAGGCCGIGDCGCLWMLVVALRRFAWCLSATVNSQVRTVALTWYP
jgi:hypothetical protein